MTAAGCADAITNKVLPCEVPQGMPLSLRSTNIVSDCGRACRCDHEQSFTSRNTSENAPKDCEAQALFVTAAGRADTLTNKALACEAHQGTPLKIVLRMCANVRNRIATYKPQRTYRDIIATFFCTMPCMGGWLLRSGMLALNREV